MLKIEIFLKLDICFFIARPRTFQTIIIIFFMLRSSAQGQVIYLFSSMGGLQDNVLFGNFDSKM